MSDVGAGGVAPHSSYVAQVVSAAVAGAEEKIARHIVILDVRGLLDSFDALVIASGGTDRQVRAIADEVERVIREKVGVGPSAVEGLSDAQWIAMDYGDVAIHLFDEDSRAYYDLEHLWNAAPAISVNAPIRDFA